MNGLTMLGVTVCLALTVLAEFCLSAVPPVLNYQGRLVDSLGTPLDGNYSFRLAIYDSDLAGSELWSETQDVTVTAGMFLVLLGSASPLSESVFSSDQRWLGIRLDSGPEFVPRRRLTTSPFAFRSGVAETAAVANSVTDNSITSDKIVDGQVQNAEIGVGAVDSKSILDQSVSQNDLADSSIVTAKIARSAITSAKIQDGAIVSADISDGTISSADIANGAVGTDDIAANSITSVKIVEGGVSSIDILNGSINSDDLGTNSVGSSEIAPDAVGAGEIIDEPGLSYNFLSGSDIPLPDGVITTILSRAINPPDTDSAYVLVIGTVRLIIGHKYGIQDWINVGVSTTSGSFTPDCKFRIDVPANVPTDQFFETVTVHGAFKVGTASDVFYLLSESFMGSGASAEAATLTLVYIPSSYGVVASPAAGASGESSPDDVQDTDYAKITEHLTSENSLLRNRLAKLEERLSWLEQLSGKK